ncbi:hypothetical protein RGF97_32515 [Streptomyces roseicoloratus]|uniref:Aromatic ring-opening dioxygenase LigA n=1 Tax=Streptomyces roseicoloratus TaxID=2508722 RepID=A0ABY9S2D1_9ACTN|nr:hypothetical protein [Streptomyces roseicoloratus]WMX48580.1 hypothetical protein RGF97_32515 [Streptomyces roseicoloratus]
MTPEPIDIKTAEAADDTGARGTSREPGIADPDIVDPGIVDPDTVEQADPVDPGSVGPVLMERGAPGPEDAAADHDAAPDGNQDEDPDEDGDEAIRTLLWTAATERPVPEVAALVARLNESGELSRLADLALRAAAVSRPLDEVRELVFVLNEAGYDLRQAETTLRAAAVGRPIEDVVALVGIIGADAGGWRAVGAAEDPARPALAGARSTAASSSIAPNPSLTPSLTPSASPSASRAGRAPKASRGPRTSARSPLDQALATGPGSHTSTPALRSTLRWPAALALLACGLIHLPTDVAGLRSGANASLLSAVVTLFCLVCGAWLVLRDSATVWAATAAGTIGLLAVHVLASARAVDVLQDSLGARFAWAQALAVLGCAAVVALAAVTLFRHTRATGAADGT